MGIKEFLRLAFSESGVPSSKRIIGTLIIVVALFCTAYSCMVEGMTEHVKSVLETEVVTAGALLGVSTIAKSISRRNEPTNIDTTSGTQPNIDNPDEETEETTDK